MIINDKRALRLLPAAALALAALALPVLAGAQPPSYAVPRGDTIHGTVSHFDGQYTMYINDDRGFMDRVSLHQGTIINPTGIRLQTGFQVTIMGYPEGHSFVANEIDTPYHYRYGGYYGYGPYYDGYGPYYGPVFGLGFGFGGYSHYGRGWHGRR